MMSGLRSSVASPARAIATSTLAGVAPLTAMWKGMLARVGSVDPLAATIRSPGTAPIICRCEAQPPRLGPASPAVAGRDRPSRDVAGGAAPDSVDPPRLAPRREGRGGAGVLAGAPARHRRSAWIAPHRQAWHSRCADDRARVGCSVRRHAGPRAEHPGAVHVDLPHGAR